MLGFDYTVTDFTTLCRDESIIMGSLVIPAAEQTEFKNVLIEFGEKKGLRFTWSMNPARPDMRFVNIMMDDISKERALKTLCVHFGINLDDVAAISDDADDVLLLETAGLAIAMDNAPNVLKAAADHITARVRYNGFSQAIQEFLL
jgi:hypothetical protein